MQLFVRGVVATASLSLAAFCAVPVHAAPVVAAVHHVAVVSLAVRASARAIARPLHFASALPLRAFIGRPFFSPLTALPLSADKHRSSSLTGLLPRLIFAAVTAPYRLHRCSPVRPAAPITVLPVTPFAGNDCFDNALGQTEKALPPASLVAAHNRNALYAPTYAPKDDLR